MDNALVTGAAGFMGSHVAERVAEMGLRVVALDDLSGGFRCNLPGDVEFHEGSIEDERLVSDLFARYRFRYVYHLAAYAAEGLSPFIRRFNYSVNLLGSINLINGAVNHGTECFVFTSSIAVYGTGQLPFVEATAPLPEDPYGISKLAVERDLLAAHALFGMDYVIFRPHNVYGPRQNLSDPYRNVVGIFINQVRQGLPCTLFGDGEQTRAFSHIDDVAPLISGSAARPEARNEIFNIGSDETHTVQDLAEMVQHAMGREVGLEYLEARPEVRDAISDHTKARELLGYRPAVDLTEGLARTIRWAATIDPAPPRSVSHVEIARNLPPSWARFTRLDPPEEP